MAYQTLLATHMGTTSFKNWLAAHKELPLPPWTHVHASNPPPRREVLIEGVLRRGHVGLMSAKAKVGKTWLAVQLAVAVSLGGQWLGHQCAQGDALLIDPEMDSASLDTRFERVCGALGVDASEVDKHVSRWSLRGVTTKRGSPPTIADIADQIERVGEEFAVVIVDSASCLIDSGNGLDENSSLGVRGFFAHVNRIAEATGASVLLIHHQGKGLAGDREASDRARGSSVWMDAPDVVMSLVEVTPPSGEAGEFLDEGERALLLECAGIREFASFPPTHLIFGYPLHRVDEDGVTEGWRPQSSARRGGMAAARINAAKADARGSTCQAVLRTYLDAHPSTASLGGAEAARICSDAMGETVSAQTLKKYLCDSEGGIGCHQRSPKRWEVVRLDDKGSDAID